MTAADTRPATGEVAARTLIDTLMAGLEADRSCKLIEINRHGETSETSYMDIWDRALIAAQRLAVPDGAGDPIILLSDTAQDVTFGLWASWLAGRSVLPLHVHALSGALGDLDRKLQRATELFGTPTFLMSRALRDRLSASVAIDRVLTLETLCDDPPSTPFDIARRRQDVELEERFEMLAWTSGSSGPPKVARIPAAVLNYRVLASRDGAIRNTTVNHFPYDGITGNSVCFPNGGTVVYLQPDRFARDPAELLRIIEDYEAASIGLSSSASWRILETIGDRRFDLSSLRRIGFGSERIVPSVIEPFLARLIEMGAGPLTIRVGYGMTEAGLICATEGRTVEETVAEMARTADSPSVGPPRPGVRLRFAGPDGRPVADGEIGVIEIAARERTFAGYVGVADHDQPFTADGWLRTGDMGFLDAGTLRITGRTKSDIVLNGRNVSLSGIETGLRDLEGVDPVRLAALPVRPPGAATEELAVFMVPDGSVDDRRIAGDIRGLTMRRAGVPTRHVLSVPSSDFPLTSSGKVARADLLAGFESGRWTRLDPPGAGTPRTGLGDDDLGDQLARLWQSVLKLPERAAPFDDFYSLGGDSFAAATIIVGAEEISGKRLEVEAFFRDPTVATMVRLLGETGEAVPHDERREDAAPRLLQQLGTYVASWKGSRLLPDSLVVGSNADGSRIPIFWVLQSDREMKALAEALGPDQPLFAMRSAVRLVQAYSSDVLDTLVNRYLWEVIALHPHGDFVLGGNCQGGIVALALARRLRQLGRHPRRLILMEWNFSYGRYDGPTRFLYGDRSPLADHYASADPDSAWRRDFHDSDAVGLPAAHGGFFHPDCLPHFARELRRDSAPSKWRDKVRRIAGPFRPRGPRLPA